VSFVVPVFQERRRIGRCLDAMGAFLPTLPFSHETLFVDDGSTDGTSEIVETAGLPSGRAIRYPTNRGKGHAVKVGMLAARGRYRLFLDVDLSTPLDQLARFLGPMERGEHVMIGTRKTAGAIVRRRQHPLRRKMGESFTILADLMLGLRVSDITCGFKCFSAEAAEAVFSRQRIDGWAFDAESLFLARKLGYRIEEIPVVWTNDAETRVRLVRDTLGSLAELVRIRAYALRGRYADAVATGPGGDPSLPQR